MDPVDDRIGSVVRMLSGHTVPRESVKRCPCTDSTSGIVEPLLILLDRDTTAIIRFAGLGSGSGWIVTYETRCDCFRAITLGEEEVDLLIREIVPADAVESAFAAPDHHWYDPEKAARMVVDGPLSIDVRPDLTAYLNPKDVPPSIRFHCASGGFTVKVPYLFLSVHAANFLAQNAAQS